MITTRQIANALILHYMLSGRVKEPPAEDVTAEELKKRIREMRDDEIISVYLPEQGGNGHEA
jgi:hypothetical protein